MSLDGILAILEERGLAISVSVDGTPSIRGNKEEVTDAVREALAAYREEIIARFRPKPRREFLWKMGHRSTDESNMPETWFPVGAWWWRQEGEQQWRPIPGTPGEQQDAPADA